jgi:integrase
VARQSTGGLMVRRHKDGRLVYAIRFRALGKRRCITLGTSEEGWTRKTAEEELQNVLADVRRGIWTPPRSRRPEERPRPTDPTFHEFAAEWFRAHRHEWRESTRDDYRWQLELHLLPFFADHRLSEITIAEVDSYTTMKVAAGKLSPTSINKTLTRLAQILELAVEYGLLDRNPARGRARRVKAVAPRRVHLDRADQIESLLEAAGALDARGRGPRLRRGLLATLVFAGLRLGEALALRWRDIDLAAGTIEVGNSKTDAGIRQIEMLPVLRDELSTYKASTVGSSPDDLVFSTGRGRALSQSNVRNRVLAGAIAEANRRRLEAGLSELPVTPHGMRRTYISALLAVGETVPFVMAQVGHANPQVTLTIYAKLMLRKDGERERLRRLLVGVDEEESNPTSSPLSHAASP